ncbi:alpha/beta fold hydrolase [Paenibacillus arenosi]|uniref:Alpha/beta hydrolase n=1 Tax=Paenibacillus arenosi TaxID=2774142 RepID=A0ABR9B0J5_9BACL|nr:alpha/beta hydrolase [Paenibacillus arenosi]MBD8499399.1 alpha/beta hydrolase [Paenibacillus arenosi]
MTKIEIQKEFHLHIGDSGKGEAVILLHGFCGNKQYWSDVVPHLQQQYRVITPDLRGHGKSTAPKGAYTIEQMADDIIVLADKLKLDKFVLLGHSLGGYVTLSVAQRFAHRLHGFGLIHSTGYADSEQAKENRLKAVERIQAQGIVQFVDELVPKLFNPNKLEQHKESIHKALEIGYHTPPQGAIGAALAMREREDRTAVMTATKLPLLLVAGDQDQIVPAERLFTTEGSHVQQVLLPDVGHMGMMENPEGMAHAISRFMESLPQQ